MAENHQIISQGFRCLLAALAPYVCEAIKRRYDSRWWELGVMNRLYDDQKRNLPPRGEDEELVAALDIQATLILFEIYWHEIFKQRFPKSYFNWIKELKVTRNDLSHIGAKDFSDNDTWRALDTMARACEPLDAENTEQIRSLLRSAYYGHMDGSLHARPKPAPESAAMKSAPNALNLPSWRDVIQPHPDVAAGRYKNAEFAADLALVARGEGSLEYRDPVEFFGRTYITEGMGRLLQGAINRVAQKGGEPVIQLKTAFGGGKTHSMLALYHLLRPSTPIEKIPSLRPILNSAGLVSAPRTHVAVLVGSALDPSKAKRPYHLPGVSVNTLWGDIASQLALSANKPELYDIVREADKKGVSPGSETLARLFDEAGACLVLMDELVAYGRKLYGQEKLPAGSFENFITFIQELTEAARASRASLVVASIPESDIEIGGEAGHKVLHAIEHTFGRMEAIWKPVTASEGFEVVRRRLFLDCADPEARDQVCKAYSELYENNPGDFPVETREADYLRRLEACYPIHPEVFDRLYEDWATLERFQRTRGVLRLMAAVIHELWAGNDRGLLIQPGSLPLDKPEARDELLRHLDQGWNAIVDMEVDGKKSEPQKLDNAHPRYGKHLACRRVARAILLGSAPSVREQRLRGLEAIRILLGIMQPGDQISIFNDALGALQTKLAHLYCDPNAKRFWYDTRPTLNKIVADRALRMDEGDIELEIETRLKKMCKKMPPIAGLHMCPVSSLDVPDEQIARLVVFGPEAGYNNQNDQNAALKKALDILQTRGNGPRSYKNTLLFLAAELNALPAIEEECRRHLAWKSISNEREILNLDVIQIKEVESGISQTSKTIDMRMQEAWIWLIAPVAFRDKPGEMRWEPVRLEARDPGIIQRTAKCLAHDELIVTGWAPHILLNELDSLLWRDADHIRISSLWADLCTYYYLPRLENWNVLLETIKNGLRQGGLFAYAAGVEDGKYLGLRLDMPAMIDKDALLVRWAAAKAQQEAEAKASSKAPESLVSDRHGGYGRGNGHAEELKLSGGLAQEARQTPKTRFYLTTSLDNVHINRRVNEIVENVINILPANARLEIRLDVQAALPEGFGKDIMRNINENCSFLKIEEAKFEEE